MGRSNQNCNLICSGTRAVRVQFVPGIDVQLLPGLGGPENRRMLARLRSYCARGDKRNHTEAKTTVLSYVGAIPGTLPPDLHKLTYPPAVSPMRPPNIDLLAFQQYSHVT